MYEYDHDYDEYVPEDEEAYADDLAAQHAVDDAKYDFPPQEEPDDYYDAPEWLVDVRCPDGVVAIIYSDETTDVEGETELTEETAWAIVSAVNLVGASMRDANGSPTVSARVLHLGEPLDRRSDAVRVGSVSPTDPAALGDWLRGVPMRTILRSHSWAPCQRGTGEEHIHRAPVREFPALFVYGGPFEITEGSEQLDQLAKYHAPFTVLALGDVQAAS